MAEPTDTYNRIGLTRAVGRVAGRMRLARATKTVAWSCLAALIVAALILLAQKLTWLSGPPGLPLTSILVPLAAWLVAWLGHVDPLSAAVRADAAHDSKSRIATALELGSRKASSLTSFEARAVEDGHRWAPRIDAKHVVPIHRPGGIAWLPFGLIAVAAALLWAPQSPERQMQIAAKKGLRDVVDAEQARQLAEDMRRSWNDIEDPALKRSAQTLEEMMSALANHELTRADALKKLSALSKDIAEGKQIDPEALREELSTIGKNLEKSKLSADTGRSLKQEQFEKAVQDMQKLSDRLKDPEVRKRELEALRKALDKNKKGDLTSELARQRDEAQKELNRLLKKKREQEREQTAAEKSLLKKKKRQLERLQRKVDEAREQQRQLERLRRELQRGAESLNRQAREQAAQDMQRAAEELNRLARQMRSEAERQELQRQIEQLREAIRRMRQQQQQGGQGQKQQGQGQGQNQRMQRFRLGAGGQGQQARLLLPGRQGQGQQGQGQQGQGQQGQGQQGQGQQGQGQQGQGQQGQGQQGQGQQGTPTLTLGQGDKGDSNVTVEIPELGQAQSIQGMGEGQEQGQGSGVGDQHDPTKLDDPTRLKGASATSTVSGEKGAGPSRGQVIKTAADKGFTATPYKAVHNEYKSHAEEVIERDQIPRGYRFYIRRYFQLIGPREDVAGPSSATSR